MTNIKLNVRSAAEDCQYVARWEYNENTDRMNFTISSRNPDNINKWTGIGFSDNANMRQTDAIIGWVEPNGRYFIMSKVEACSLECVHSHYATSFLLVTSDFHSGPAHFEIARSVRCLARVAKWTRAWLSACRFTMTNMQSRREWNGIPGVSLIR